MTNPEQILTLQEQLDARRIGSKAGPEQRKIMDAATAELEASGIINEMLQVGQTAPDFTLPRPDGSTVTLSDALKTGPVVLVFYRGGWCPYCNLALRAYQNILPQIEAHGASLIAVTPETPDNSLSTTEKNELAFAVLSDDDNAVARTYGLVFRLPDDLREVYLKFGHDLEKRHGNDHWELPVPGTFVIDTDGVVRYAFGEADYTKRAEPADILAALESLRG